MITQLYDAIWCIRNDITMIAGIVKGAVFELTFTDNYDIEACVELIDFVLDKGLIFRVPRVYKNSQIRERLTEKGFIVTKFNDLEGFEIRGKK